MKTATQEQIKEFWEWCGLKPEKITHAITGCTMADGRTFAGGSKTEFIYPDIDLNNLFKYAVPKFQRDKGCCVTLQAYECKGYQAFVSQSVFSQRGPDGYDPYLKPISRYEDNDPALALFWAIWEVIKEANHA